MTQGSIASFYYPGSSEIMCNVENKRYINHDKLGISHPDQSMLIIYLGTRVCNMRLP